MLGCTIFNGVLESNSMLHTVNTISIWPLTELAVKTEVETLCCLLPTSLTVVVISAIKKKSRILWKQAYASLDSGKDSPDNVVFE